MVKKSKLIKCSGYAWDSIPRKDYKPDNSCYRGVHRYSLLGESEDEQLLNFQTRYFEVEAGGYTTLEYHRHPHSVVIIRGKGSVILGEEVHKVGLHDVIYISPETLHQFHADAGEPLGFLCIVDRYRDKPVLPDETYLHQIPENAPALKKLRR